MKKFSVVIPARYASSRLPAKPLKDIAGKPMIQHVYECCKLSDAAQVIIATDDERIKVAAEAFGAPVVMTSPEHLSGTDRLEEVVRHLMLADDEIVVNVQGDEPLIPAAVINQVARNLADNPAASASTLSEPIHTSEDFCNPNIVKVVANCAGQAMYFSRAPIPWPRDAFAQGTDTLPQAFVPQRHIGIYGYRVALLKRFVQWGASSLELLECLEQLRILEQGEVIHVEPACELVPGGVDTEEDLERVRAHFAAK